MPDDLRHRLRFDVVAETVANGSLVEASTLEVEDFADAIANQPIGVLNIERVGLKALGATILSGLEGGTTYVPCLVVGETVLVGTGAIRFGGTGGPFDVVAAFRQRLPAQAELDPGRGRPLVQLAVDGGDMAIGVLQQFLDLRGDFGLQVVLQHIALTLGKDLPTLGNLDTDHWKLIAKGPLTLAKAVDEQPVNYPAGT